MGLAHRVIPVLLYRHGHLVKGKKFDSTRVVGNAQQATEIHQARGVDEMIVLDVAATPEGRGPDIKAMARLTESGFMPIAVGGGITEIEHVRQLLANGADKVVIGTAAVMDPNLVKKCADKFGSQAITVAVDVRKVKHGWWTTSHCGEIEHWFLDAVGFAQMMERAGAGELIVTNIGRDGMMQGYDLQLIDVISHSVNIPVIANGGAGTYTHMHKALTYGASAVAAGAMFLWTEATPHGAAEFLARKGWEMRL